VFCYQCEQTKNGTGCTSFGVCGKDPTSAALQNLLIYMAKGIAMYARRAREWGARDAGVDRFTIEALFTTVTNVNFDPDRLEQLVRRAAAMRDRARDLADRAAVAKGEKLPSLSGPATFVPAGDLAGLLEQERSIGIEARRGARGDDVVGLQELLTYGLKGAAAYADHALILGKEDEKLWSFFHEALDFLASDPEDIGALTAMCLRCGEMNLRVMELLDEANTGAYGMPAPTKVRIEPIAGKAILVSGHDLKDLEAILRQTEGKGINVYTHGEMLPAHAYPGLKKYSHLVGNYGGAWQDQQKEFDAFPGAILMTTNCIQKPRETYSGRIFTSGLVAWPGVRHISDRNFAPVIDAALRAPGFATDGLNKTITVGFGHHAVLGVAGAVVDAVKATISSWSQSQCGRSPSQVGYASLPW